MPARVALHVTSSGRVVAAAVPGTCGRDGQVCGAHQLDVGPVTAGRVLRERCHMRRAWQCDCRGRRLRGVGGCDQRQSVLRRVEAGRGERPSSESWTLPSPTCSVSGHAPCAVRCATRAASCTRRDDVSSSLRQHRNLARVRAREPSYCSSAVSCAADCSPCVSRRRRGESTFAPNGHWCVGDRRPSAPVVSVRATWHFNNRRPAPATLGVRVGGDADLGHTMAPPTRSVFVGRARSCVHCCRPCVARQLARPVDRAAYAAVVARDRI